MEKLLLKLAGELLKNYGDDLSNNGCNDPTDEVNEIIELFNDREFDEMLDEWNGGECQDGRFYDWIIAKAVGEKLIEIAESKH